MNIVSEEKVFRLQNETRENYKYASDEEVNNISKRVLKKHREAYIALANA